MQVKIKKLTSDAVIPTYATPGSACFDISTTTTGIIPANHTAVLHTGLAFEIPQDHVMLVFSRSGHGFKRDVRLSNCVGVIDSDYRGELLVKMRTDGYFNMPVESGDRIAQGMIIPVQQVAFLEEEELSDTSRGTGGFGSTGQN